MKHALELNQDKLVAMWADRGSSLKLLSEVGEFSTGMDINRSFHFSSSRASKESAIMIRESEANLDKLWDLANR